MDVIVEINNGKIRGYEGDDVKIFKGIPYAEPPIGELRLNTPKPKEPWNGMLDASEYRSVAPQPLPVTDFFPPPPQSEEECLNLNIWTPGCDTMKRPVLFWIHGGSHIYGSGRLLNGRSISRIGDIVLVSINYRLGPLGYLYIPGAPTNIGQLDQILALEWVRDNIESFGGDPSNVTIFGESAGATSVCTLMAMPKAKGLFSRAISQSSAVQAKGFEVSGRKFTAEMILKELNLSNDDLSGYRKLPVEDIIKAFMKAQEKALLDRKALEFRPFIDNDTLPQHPIKAIQEGYAKDIELIVGTNLEEWRFWRVFEPKFEEYEDSRIKKRILNSMGLIGEEEVKLDGLIDVYKMSRKESGLEMNIHDIHDAYMSDLIFRTPSIKFAEAQSKHQKNTYMYLFKWKTPFEGGRYGAMHAMEIAFVFGAFWEDDLWTFPKKTTETETLSKKMMNYWVNFARNGDPNSNDALEWPSYEIESRKTIIFDKEVEIWDDPLSKEREMWYSMNQWSQF
ncbi:MAG: carboxylesterase/lipase family protein [Candidatus Lokiarchaeota archaeon]|nr:carboxylesterase/lipase family protein [Candidatus Lokiarchaeota archaeon]